MNNHYYKDFSLGPQSEWCKEYIQQDLLNDDELLNCMSGNFYPFRESKIEFLPSYKMEFKKQAYIDSRTPSWYFFLEF